MSWEERLLLQLLLVLHQFPLNLNALPHKCNREEEEETI